MVPRRPREKVSCEKDICIPLVKAMAQAINDSLVKVLA